MERNPMYSAKESRSYWCGQIIEVFDLKGNTFCPVKAIKDYWEHALEQTGMPQLSDLTQECAIGRHS